MMENQLINRVTFSQKIIEILKDDAYSTKELSKIIKISEAIIISWIECRKDPKIHELIQLSRACNRSIDYLIGNHDFEFDNLISDKRFQINSALNKIGIENYTQNEINVLINAIYSTHENIETYRNRFNFKINKENLLLSEKRQCKIHKDIAVTEA